MAEAVQRLTAIYATRTRSDLTALLADLPPPHDRPAHSGWAWIWASVVEEVWLASARLRGSSRTPPSPGQRRLVTTVLIAATLWTLVALLAGFTAGVVG